ncbi:hypothetical protein HPB49_022908 [Dermacentor silvarum]|uniref:Uncharacterized protein n=1 Tax=Dermacentor silvarum TaxID=543639 RepID=A0ACB8DFR3_DERSI|nr:hypothetical protein HPB49_022908 [Dermacentor silvarum]
MPDCCCAPNCKSNYVHMFPNDPVRRAAWTEAVSRKDFAPTKNTVLCEKHFAASDYVKTPKYTDVKTGKINKVPLKAFRLKPDARRGYSVSRSWGLCADGGREGQGVVSPVHGGYREEAPCRVRRHVHVRYVQVTLELSALSVDASLASSFEEFMTHVPCMGFAFIVLLTSGGSDRCPSRAQSTVAVLVRWRMALPAAVFCSLAFAKAITASDSSAKVLWIPRAANFSFEVVKGRPRASDDGIDLFLVAFV